MAETFTAENLLARGYREHPASALHNNASRFFQRRVLGDQGQTLYFINCYYYDDLRGQIPASWETDSQMQRSGVTINIHVFSTNDIDEAEAMIADIFGLGMKAYDNDVGHPPQEKQR